MTTIWKALVVFSLVLSAIAIYVAIPTTPSMSIGSLGPKLIEQYDPYVKYNGGISSALPIQTSGNLILSATNGCLQVNLAGTTYHTVASSTSKVNGVATGVLLLSSGSC